jgi:hypothetical protein
MPALPWVELQAIAPDHEYVAMGSRLPLKSYLSVPGFLRATMHIRQQLATTPGLVGYALNAQLLRMTFWTFSVWSDQASLDAFAAANPHHAIVERIRPRMEPTHFEFFAIRGADVPLPWDRVMTRVA